MEGLPLVLGTEFGIWDNRVMYAGVPDDLE